MRLLLDTHIFAWYVLEDPKLSPELRETISSEEHEVFLSLVSVWEAAIKYYSGRWPLPRPAEALFPDLRRDHKIIDLPIDEDSIAQAVRLPPLHRDPFDRMLIGQTISYGLTLVTVDPAIRAYPNVPVL